MTIKQISTASYLPFDWAGEIEHRRIRLVARRCRVSLSTAATLIILAGLSSQEGRE
jgi:hypothetical protein